MFIRLLFQLIVHILSYIPHGLTMGQWANCPILFIRGVSQSFQGAIEVRLTGVRRLRLLLRCASGLRRSQEDAFGDWTEVAGVRCLNQAKMWNQCTDPETHVFVVRRMRQ